MNTRTVLVLGSGAREDALASALLRSPGTTRVVVAPGNASAVGERAAVSGGITPVSAVAAARQARADLVVVGPEAPLVAGVVDALEEAGFAAFGPRANAAVLEGSKAFLKRFAREHEIPTAPFEIATSYAEAEAIVKRRGAPIVVKADGLCAGKGVVVASSEHEALEAARAMLVDGVFGDAGRVVVLEEVIAGEEASVHAVTDGERLLVLPVARDHKRLGDGDTGPNTGGMGVIAPTARVSPELLARIERTILRPTLDGMRAQGRPFRGVLFAGIMVTPAGEPMLLEHNVRFGDPECEALMALLEGDLFALLASAARGTLAPEAVHVPAGRHATVVVLASRGYPAAPVTGDVITGIEAAAELDGVTVHHAGTARRGGEIVTAGGRVLAVTGAGATAAEARARAYEAASRIRFEGMQLRRDVGAS